MDSSSAGPDETGPIPTLPESILAESETTGGAGAFGTPTKRWLIVGVLAAAASAGAVFLFVPRADEDRMTAERFEHALHVAFERGAGTGGWQIQEAHGDSRKRTFADDPNDPTRVHCRFDDTEGAPILAFSRSHVVRRVFGESPLALFFRNYHPGGPGTSEPIDGRATLRVEWTTSVGPGQGPARVVWMDDVSGDLVGLEDRAFDGALIHSARLVTRALGEWHPAASAPGTAGAAREEHRGAASTSASTSSSSFFNCCGSFEEVVRQAPFPIYEPTRLPPGFERVDARFFSSRVRAGGETAKLSVVQMKYSDGLAKIEVWIARPEDLKRLDEWTAKWSHRDPSACPTSGANTPEDLLPDDSMVIRRRVDKCRTLLRVDPIVGLAVEVIGRNELPGEAYLAAIKSLERVPGSKDLPVEPSDDQEKAGGEGKPGGETKPAK